MPSETIIEADIYADPRWVEYERRKNTWMAQNPAASHAEVHEALKRIVQELGI
jgi:2-C-methyl-D-erythritol 4-phosphate cytidylyltransferase